LQKHCHMQINLQYLCVECSNKHNGAVVWIQMPAYRVIEGSIEDQTEITLSNISCSAG